MTDRLLVVDLAAISKNWALTPEGERRIREATPPGWRIHVVTAPTSSDGDGPPRPSDEVMDAIVDAEAYYGFGIPKLLFAEAKRLRWVHSAAAGVGSAMYPEMVESDVLFSNSAGVHGVPIAEYIVAGVLHFLRGFDIAIDLQRRTEWNKTPFVRMDSVLREMDSVHALIIGVGGLGGGAGERLAALGAHVTGVRRRVELGPPPGFERVISLDALDAELPKHDVVVLAAPLTAQTNGILTAERLDLLPRNAIVVNVARGAT
jgi:phosphoglycerate dehydrogenase-like enzyme